MLIIVTTMNHGVSQGIFILFREENDHSAAALVIGKVKKTCQYFQLHSASLYR